MAYRTLKYIMLKGNFYRKGHVFPVGSEEHGLIRPNDIEEGRVEEISEDEAVTQTQSSRALFQPKKRGRGNPSEL